MRCSRCQGLGHIASECPNKEIVTLAESQASFEELEKEEEVGKEVCLNEPIEEVEEGPDEGELLMIRRALDQGAVPTALDNLLITPPLKDSQHVLPQEMSHGSPKNLLLIPYLKAEPCPHHFIPPFQAHNLAAPSTIPHGLILQGTITHKEDLPHKTHEDLLSLRPNSKQAGEYDGDHPPSNDTIMEEGGGGSKEAKEIQGLVRIELKQSNSALGTSPGNKLFFVYILGQDLLGGIACNSPYLYV